MEFRVAYGLWIPAIPLWEVPIPLWENGAEVSFQGKIKQKMARESSPDAINISGSKRHKGQYHQMTLLKYSYISQANLSLLSDILVLRKGLTYVYRHSWYHRYWFFLTAESNPIPEPTLWSYSPQTSEPHHLGFGFGWKRYQFFTFLLILSKIKLMWNLLGTRHLDCRFEILWKSLETYLRINYGPIPRQIYLELHCWKRQYHFLSTLSWMLVTQLLENK